MNQSTTPSDRVITSQASPQKTSQKVLSAAPALCDDCNELRRFVQFEPKAEIIYLPDEDDLAERAYADRFALKD